MQKISGEFGEFKVACAIFSPFFHSLDLLVLLHQGKRTGNRYSYRKYKQCSNMQFLQPFYPIFTLLAGYLDK